MARTNAEIAQDLSDTITGLNKAKETLATLEERIDNHRELAKVQFVALGKDLERLEQVVHRLQEAIGRDREQWTETNRSHSELKADFKNLRKQVEDERKWRWGLLAGLILTAVSAILQAL